MTDFVFNPPPGWPPAPAGWTPPAGWAPPAEWPIPDGWVFWVPKEPEVPALPGVPVIDLSAELPPAPEVTRPVPLEPPVTDVDFFADAPVVLAKTKTVKPELRPADTEKAPDRKVRGLHLVERTTRFELATSTLARLRSTN